MAFLASLWGLRFAITSSALLKHQKHPKKRLLFLSWEDRMAAEQPRAEEQNEATRGPNCHHPRFFLKTKGVCTHTEHGRVCFDSIPDYNALIRAFRPRLIVGDQIRHVPDGIYCWILREKEGEHRVYAMKVICEQEIGSLHNFIFLLSSNPGPLLTEKKVFRDANQVLAAGEFLMRGGEALWNLQSGSFMEPTFGIKVKSERSGKPKKEDELMKEVGNKLDARKVLIETVSTYLPGHFVELDPPKSALFKNSRASQYTNALSHSLGGRPFLYRVDPDYPHRWEGLPHRDPIITTENNMGLLRSVLREAEVPVEDAVISVEFPAEPSAEESKKSAKRAKKGGARKTRKARRSYKSRRACRV